MIVFDNLKTTPGARRDQALSARVQRAVTNICDVPRSCFHTHQPWALALNMLKDNRLCPPTRLRPFFTAIFMMMTIPAPLIRWRKANCSWRDRETSRSLFMKNHGVIATGDNIGQAYKRLYKTERVCRAQVLALSTGRPISIVGRRRETASAVEATGIYAERERLYFGMMRVLDRELPGYADPNKRTCQSLAAQPLGAKAKTARIMAASRM